MEIVNHRRIRAITLATGMVVSSLAASMVTAEKAAAQTWQGYRCSDERSDLAATRRVTPQDWNAIMCMTLRISRRIRAECNVSNPRALAQAQINHCLDLMRQDAHWLRRCNEMVAGTCTSELTLNRDLQTLFRSAQAQGGTQTASAQSRTCASLVRQAIDEVNSGNARCGDNRYEQNIGWCENKSRRQIQVWRRFISSGCANSDDVRIYSQNIRNAEYSLSYVYPTARANARGGGSSAPSRLEICRYPSGGVAAGPGIGVICN